MRTTALQSDAPFTTVRSADLDLLHNPRDAATFSRKLFSSDGGGYFRELADEFITNCDWLEGAYKQWREWKDGERKLKPEVAKFDEQVVAFNWIQEVVDTLVARHMRPMGLPKSSGVTTDPPDVRAARKQSDVLRYLFERVLKGPVYLADFLVKSFCAKVVFANVDYSPYCGKIIQTSLEDFVLGRMDEQPDDPATLDSAVSEFVETFGKDAAKKRRIVQHEGDLKARTLIGGVNVFWYPRRIDSWEQDLLAVGELEETPIELAAERLEMSVEKVRTLAAGDPKHVNPFGVSRVNAIESRGMVDRDAETVSWRRVQHRPTLKYPEGVEFIHLGAASKALRLGPIRNKDHQFSYLPYSQKLMPDQAVGKCAISDLRSLARDTNRWASLRTLMAEYSVFGVWAVPDDGVVNPNDWKVPTAPGKQFRVRSAGGLPVNITTKSAIPEADAIIAANVDAGKQVSGVGYISAGRPDKAGTISGRAMGAMNEAIAERDVPNIVRLGYLFSEFWTLAIVEYMDKASGDRIAELLGEDNAIEVQSFRPEDLRPTTWNRPGARRALVTVQMDTDAPMAPSERRNFTLAYLKALRSAGITISGAQVDRLVHQSDLRLFEDKDRTHRNRANWNIEQWRQGEMISPPLSAVRAWRCDIHLEEIEAWKCRGQEFEELIGELPYLESHIESFCRMLERMIERQKIRPMLAGDVGRVEEWMAAFENIESDIRSGVISPRMMQLIQPTPDGGPPLLLPLSGILRFGLSAPPRGDETGGTAGPASKPGVPPVRHRRETAEKVGDGNVRDEHRDMSEQGYDRNNLAGAKPAALPVT